MDGLTEARAETFEITGVNDIHSAAYKREFRKIINREHLNEDHLHPQVRKTCFAIIENREAVDGWHAKLDQHQKMQWNSPDAVLRHWKATLPPSLKPQKRTREEPDPSGVLADMAEHAAKDAKDAGAFDDTIPFGDPRVEELEAENERLKAEISELNDVIEHLRAKLAETGAGPAPKPDRAKKVKVTVGKKGDGIITGILG